MFYDLQFYSINISQFYNNNKPSPKTINLTVTNNKMYNEDNSLNKTNTSKASPKRVSNKKYPYIYVIGIPTFF